MKSKGLIILFILPLLFLTGCNMVHQWPEGGGEDPTDILLVLKIKAQTDFAGNYVVSKAPMDLSGEVPGKYDRRYIVEIRNGEYNSDIVDTQVITRAADDETDLFVKSNLKARKYKVIVWMDYVLKGTKKDLYYTCGNGSQMTAVHVPSKDKYVAGTDYKDGQHYLSDVDLTKHADKWFSIDTIDVPLQRPMAKITFLSTDIEKYAESISWKGSLEELAKSLSVEISYNGYFPTGFNAVTGRLNDAEVGYGFQYKPSYPRTFEQKTYTIVGSDYVFVNGESSSVTISAVIRDKQGNIVNEVNSIVVPIFKNIETIVTDKFFTKEYVPGIGINPQFDGEFNVYV